MLPNRHRGGKNVDMPLISVIIPVYNVEKYLDRCLESVVNQTYKNLEIILVDDGSPDNCPKMCDEWAKKDSRIRTIHKINGGLSAARNAGMDALTGDYIGFVDSDDWIEINMFERLISILTDYSADMAVCDIQLDKFKRPATQPKHIITSSWGRKECLNSFFRINGEKSNTGVYRYLLSKKVFGNYRFVNGMINEDVHAAYFFSSRCTNAAVTNEVLYHYYQNPKSITNCTFNKKKMDLIKMWEMVYEMVKKENPQYLYACSMNLKRSYFTLLSRMKIDGYDKKDKEYVALQSFLKNKVRLYYWDLMRWKMPISRKILLVLVCL